MNGASPANRAAELARIFRSSPLCASLDAEGIGRLVEVWDYVAAGDGEVVLTEGDSGRDMFVVLDGRAEVSRQGIDVTVLGPGDAFGELALVSGQPRSATVRATGSLVLARLSRSAFETLSDRHPIVAQRLLHAMVMNLGARLTELTDNVGLLLHERSLPRRTTVAVGLEGSTRTVRVGTRIREVLPARAGEDLVVAALMDNKAVSLQLALSADCRLEPLTTAHWEGQRIYHSSVDLLLLEAVHRVDPSLRVRLGGTAGPARRILLDPAQAWRDGDLFARIEETMRGLAAADAPLLEELWTVEEAEDHFRRVGSPAVDLLATHRDETVALASYGLYYVLRTSPLVPSAGALAGFRIVQDQHGWLLVYREEHALAALQIAGWQGAAMPYAHEPWLRALRIQSVGQFNRASITGSVPELIRVVEGYHEKRIGEIADEIARRTRDVRLVSIAGPSSAGKTTFIKRLRVQLQVDGIHPIGISTDDYYVDREKTPRDAAGEFDFEALEALDLDRLDRDLRALLAGETVRLPRFDFRTGRSHPEGGSLLKVQPGDLLLLEGIHGLNPRIVAGLDPTAVHRIFVCPRAQLVYDECSRVHSSDLRLLRRIVRDRHARSAGAGETIARWPSVRAGERRHIFPFQQHAETVFDSSLLYELSVLKVYAERYLFEVEKVHPAFPTALRLLRLLDDFVAIYPDQVPPTSLLREFIGGSGFEY